MASGSQRAVITAIAGNGILTVLKFAVAVPTHSAAMMNEAVHSLMDTLNQIFLLIGLIQGNVASMLLRVSTVKRRCHQ